MATRTTFKRLAATLAAVPGRVERAATAGLTGAEGVAVAGVRRTVLAGMSPDGSPLKPLKKPRPGGGPLNKTGRMIRSVRARITAADGLVLSSDHPAARPQQDGTRHIPPRPWLGFGRQTVAEITAMVGAKVAGVIGRLGGP